MKRIVRYFLQGLIYIAPAGITIYIVYLVFNLLDNYLRTFLERFIHISIPGLGIIALILGITMLGFIGQSILFRPINRLIDRIMNQAPIVKVIYSSLKDLLSAFVGKEKKFKQPVLVKVNLISDLHKMGFITQSDLTDINIKDKVAVYFPHSYNFSGEMFIVPTEHIAPLDIPSAEAMKFIVSGGVAKAWEENKL
jgi:uncharacterized membrane protein